METRRRRNQSNRHCVCSRIKHHRVIQEENDTSDEISLQIGSGSGRAETIAGKHREAKAQLGDEAKTGEGDGESQREIHENDREAGSPAGGREG